MGARWTPHIERELIRLREAGYTYPMIAHLLRKTSSAVAGKCMRMQLDKRPHGRRKRDQFSEVPR